jgi:hypothetical protein
MSAILSAIAFCHGQLARHSTIKSIAFILGNRDINNGRIKTGGSHAADNEQ